MALSGILTRSWSTLHVFHPMSTAVTAKGEPAEDERQGKREEHERERGRDTEMRVKGDRRIVCGGPE